MKTKFKHIRQLIYSPAILILGDKKIKAYPIYKLDNTYDNFEVIGIRSMDIIESDKEFYNSDYDSVVLISLKRV